MLTTDDAYAAVAAERAAFLRRLGSHYCSKTSTCPTWCSSSSPDGTDGELAFAPASDLRGLHAGPCRVLLDKQGILTEAACPWPVVARADQRETLRRLLHWFWHDLSHFITALGRGQLWWARAPE